MPRHKKIMSSVMAVCLAVTMAPALNVAAYADELQTASVTVQELSSLHVLNHADIEYNGKMHKVRIGHNAGPYKPKASMPWTSELNRKNGAVEFKRLLKKYSLNKVKVVVPKSAVKSDEFRDRKADKELGY